MRVSKTGVADFSPQQHIHKNEKNKWGYLQVAELPHVK
jgi:hypothetical protein